MEMGGNENSTFPIYHLQVADHETLLIDPCFCIVICCSLLGLSFPLHVHETLLALTLQCTCKPIYEDL